MIFIKVIFSKIILTKNFKLIPIAKYVFYFNLYIACYKQKSVNPVSKTVLSCQKTQGVNRQRSNYPRYI